MPLVCFISLQESPRGPASRPALHVLAPLALGLCLVSQAFAQSPVDGTLQGRVFTSPHGPPVPASVHLRSDGNSWQQTVNAARDGSFTVLDLAPGDYTIQAGPCALQHLSISPGAITEAEIDLASCPTSQPHSPQPSALPLPALDDTELSELDSAAHNATLAAAPSDETSGDEPATPEAARETTELGLAGPSVSGLSPAANSTLLDGLSTTQNFHSSPRGAAGSPRTSATFSESSTRSFRLQPRSFSAQNGSAGGLIAVTSRGQATRVHGTAFALTRQSAFAATNPFSVLTRYNNGVITSYRIKPADSFIQAGAAAGFPLSKAPYLWLQHASLFLSLEGQIRSSQVVSTPATASFYALTAEQLALLANRGVPASAANSALNFLDSLTGTQSRDATRLLSFVRLDLVPAVKQQLTLGYIGNRFNSPTGSSSGASAAVVPRGRASVAGRILHVDALTGRWLYRLSPLAANELRGQFAHDLEFETPHTPLPQEPAISAGGFAPQVSISPNGFSYGTPSSIGRIAYPDEHRLQLADTFTLARGRHLFTSGADWSRITDRIAAATNQEGTFLYDSGTTNGRDGGLVDWITDYTFNVHAYPNGACPSINATIHLFCFRSYTQGFSAASTQFATHELAFFAEDALRLPHSLSLTLGLRYDYTLLPPPQNPNPALDQVLSSIGSPIAGATSVIPEDRNNIGPRVSLAWSPARGRILSARLGYGVFYGRIAGASVNAALTDTALASTTRRIRITPSTITGCPQVANQGFGYPCAYTTMPPSAVAQTTSALVFSNRFRLPTVQRATFSLEHSTRALELRAGYAMAIATQLPQSVDLNIAPSMAAASFVLQGGDGMRGLSSGQSFAVPLYTTRRTSAFGPIGALVSNANATYHSFNAEARLHTRALELRGSYTFARAIDYGPQLSATPRANGQFDPFTNAYDKSLSSLDVRHRFAGDLLLRSSLHSRSELLRRSLSGWQLATIATAGSGAPYSYAIFGGTALSGGRDTINGAGGATYLPTLGRNTLRLPMRSRVDLRAGRGFELHEHVRLNAFAEAFNMLNTQSLSRVETRAFLVGAPATAGAPTPLVFQDAATVASEGITTAPFGTPTSSTAGLSRERRIQFGLRLEF
ncbi:MAG TPA: TonB-dependent receptor [Acidobacteriaceae bacterium]|nr:TonB-dependent receptor [Acidobacteriaceae bacterium]